MDGDLALRSFPISADDFEQLLGGLCFRRVGTLIRIDEIACAHDLRRLRVSN
jgi:hypothetical protein